MRKQIMIISVIASLAATPVFASSGVSQSGSSKEESIGVGAGATLGAIAGGPVGLMIGAMIGAAVEELLRQIAIGTMDLYAIKTCINRQPSRSCKVGNHPGDSIGVEGGGQGERLGAL